MKTITSQDVDALQQHLEARFNVVLDLHYVPDWKLLQVGRILVPTEAQGVGVGTQVLKKITDFADDHNLILSLTPSTDFGASSLSRLNQFYGRFGFKRNRDDKIPDVLVRKPALAPPPLNT